MIPTLMDAANVRQSLFPSMRVCIKPNLVAASPAEEGSTTHPSVVEGIIQYLLDCEVHNIVIAEGSWVGASTARAWDVCGYAALARRYPIRLVDTKTDTVVRKKAGQLALSLCETPLYTDYFINVPVLKGHCQTNLTCCLKNLKGCIPDSEKRRFHTMGLDMPIAALASILKPNLHIVDNICGDLCFEEGGSPVESNRVLLGFDPVALDSFCARLIGYQPDEIGHLRLAMQMGVGQYVDESTVITEFDAEKRPARQTTDCRAVKRYAPYIAESSACSPCYAALIYALHHTGYRPKERICIGQGYRNKQIHGFGVGVCASGCTRCVPGCPPNAADIIAFLRKANPASS